MRKGKKEETFTSLHNQPFSEKKDWQKFTSFLQKTPKIDTTNHFLILFLLFLCVTIPVPYYVHDARIMRPLHRHSLSR